MLKSYSNPDPRPLDQWLLVFGLECKKTLPTNSSFLSYDEFIKLLGQHRFLFKGSGPLYNFWRQYGDIYGEPRTVADWLKDLGLQLVNPTEQDQLDMQLFLGHDDFYLWSAGKVEEDASTNI